MIMRKKRKMRRIDAIERMLVRSSVRCWAIPRHNSRLT
jgi:hypothetical protein